ncbi:MAG: hypothetical protein WBO55_06145 [Rhizobiaceae bacterium]
MFRVAFRAMHLFATPLRAALAVITVLASVSLASAPALAGQWKKHQSGKRTQIVRIAPVAVAHPRPQWRNSSHHVRYGARHPAASSGVMLGGSQYHRGQIRHQHGYGHSRHADNRGHRRKHHGRRPFVIIVNGDGGQGTQARDWSNGATSGTVPHLEGGHCAPDGYCVTRLGYGANAPKIITLNRTGRAITDEDFAVR